MLKKNAVDIPVTNNVVKASEALPIDLLPAFEKVKLGEVVIYPNGQQVIVAEIIEIKDAPVSQAQAGPVIEQFIMNQLEHLNLFDIQRSVFRQRMAFGYC